MSTHSSVSIFQQGAMSPAYTKDTVMTIRQPTTLPFLNILTTVYEQLHASGGKHYNGIGPLHQTTLATDYNFLFSLSFPW